LRADHRDAGEIEIVAPQLGKDFGKPGGGVGLKAGRAEIAQNRVVAGLVGLI
jgi:hypothetical protein